MAEKQIFTLSQVARSIRKTIESRYVQPYWIKAEIHKLNLFASGHAFPELVEKREDKVVAQFSGVIWKSHLQRINQRFIQTLKEPLREGSTFLIQATIQFSETHGISLNIVDIDPDYSLGELQRERKETLERLEKEGLLRRNQQLSFPRLPKRVAIISAETSKGLSDFMKILSHNQANYVVDTFLFPSYMQGEQAVNSIIQQISKINQINDRFDVVAIVRGGGGEIGMACYNNYNLCRAIATCNLPVLTGIGHSTNFTVAEMVAYQNSITPTELADSLLSIFQAEDITLAQFRKTIVEKSVDKMVAVKDHLTHTRKALIQQSTLIIELHKRTQTRNNHQLAALARQTLQTHQGKINQFRQHVDAISKQRLTHQKEELMRLKDRIGRTYSHQLQVSNLSINQLEAQVKLMDPINVLQRGYSIVRKEGKTVNMSNLPNTNDVIQIETANFILDATVSQIQKNERE